MNFEVRSYTWSKKSDFDLPAWSASEGQWSVGFETLWGSTEPSRIIKNIAELREVLEEKPTQALVRRIVYIPHNLVNENKLLWRQICDEFNLDYPMIVKGDEYVAVNRENRIPMLGIVLDPATHQNKVSQLTIMIPHWESLGFLRLCLWSINKHYKKNMPKFWTFAPRQ